MQQVKATTLGAYEHQEVPFEKVVEAVIKDRDASRSPLFQVMLVLANTPEVAALQLGDLQLSREPYDTHISKFDLTIFITQTPQGLSGKIEYSTDLYEAATIERMSEHFSNLLSSVVSNPSQSIGLLPMLSPVSAQQLTTGFNVNKVAYPQEKSIVGLFEEQATKHHIKQRWYLKMNGLITNNLTNVPTSWRIIYTAKV